MEKIRAEKLMCKAGKLPCNYRSLEDVSFTVAEGELFCVLGSAKAGKTSLVAAISGLLPISGGELSVSGLNCRDSEALCRIREKCAFVFENAEELYLSNHVQTELAFAARNFGMDDERIEKNIAAALHAVGLDGCENASMPLLTPFERYCVAIAAALVCEPEIILIDSLAAAFDAVDGGRILDIVKKLHESGITVVYTTQNAQYASEADRVLIMKEGRVLRCDKPGALYADTALLDEAGVELPFTVRVYRDLINAGAKLDACPLNIDELVDEVCR